MSVFYSQSKTNNQKQLMQKKSTTLIPLEQTEPGTVQ